MRAVNCLKNEPLIVTLFKRKQPCYGIVLGVGTFVIGLLISLSIGAEWFFLGNWLFYLGSIIIAINILGIVWGYGSLSKVFNELRNEFEISEKDFTQLANELRKNVSNEKKAILCSIPGFALVGIAYYQVKSGQATIFIPVPTNVGWTLPLSIYSIVVFSLCAFLGLSTVYMFYCFLRFIEKITKHDIKVSVLQKNGQVGIDRTIQFIFKMTFSWFIAVSLIMTLLLTYSSIYIIGVLLILVIAGFAIFFVPQYFFHRSIVRSKEKLLNNIEASFSKAKANPPISEDCNIQIGLLSCLEFEQVNRIGNYPLDIPLFLQIIFSGLIPIVTTVIAILLT